MLILFPCLIYVLILVLSLISKWWFVCSVLLFYDNFNQFIIKLLAFLFLVSDGWLGTIILFGSTTFLIFYFHKCFIDFIRVLKSYMLVDMISVLFERFDTILLCSLLTARFRAVLYNTRWSCTERVSWLIVFPLIVSTNLIRFRPDTGL